MKIGHVESLLASFLFVLNFYGEILGGRGFVTVLSTIVLQAPLDRAHGELPSDTWTLILHFEIFREKSGEIWRSEIASHSKLSAKLDFELAGLAKVVRFGGPKLLVIVNYQLSLTLS